MAIVALVLAYLLGGIPFGYLLVRLRSGHDVRESGSGNIGATNVLRTEGRMLGVLTLALDIAKGYSAVWIASRLTNADPPAMALAALAVVAGHAFPVFLKFKGGKAVASFVGAFLFLAPLPLLDTTIVFLVTVAVSRHISLGSILGALMFPLAVFLIQHPPVSILVASIAGGAFIVWRHKSNLDRLRAGNESKFRFGGARA